MVTGPLGRGNLGCDGTSGGSARCAGHYSSDGRLRNPILFPQRYLPSPLGVSFSNLNDLRIRKRGVVMGFAGLSTAPSNYASSIPRLTFPGQVRQSVVCSVGIQVRCRLALLRWTQECGQNQPVDGVLFSRAVRGRQKYTPVTSPVGLDAKDLGGVKRPPSPSSVRPNPSEAANVISPLKSNNRPPNVVKTHDLSIYA